MFFSHCSKQLVDKLFKDSRKVVSILLINQGSTPGINYGMVNHYSMKSSLPIKWVRPEKIPCYKPEKSGDREPLPEIDLNQLAPEFRGLEELKSADENVKRLFTLKYLPYKKTVAVYREEFLNRVKRHQLDSSSPEARLAKMTADIRDMQRFVEKYPYDKRTRVRVKETIDKRKRLLKLLRTWDYKCFEYVLEKLNIIYKPYPEPDVYRRVERKRSLRMLTDQLCEKIKAEKLSKYRELLESQQEEFLEEKLNSLKWIMDKEKLFGLKPSVSEADIASVEQKLSQIREERKKDTVAVAE